MQNVQLYIDGERADLFEGDTITLQSSIQNIRDIQKVFADYTKGLSLPASKTNNKIFKHFYNFDIENGFNARKKVSAEIHINYVPFKVGKIALNSVKMRHNKAFSYDITFFSNIVELPDRLGSKLLGDLQLFIDGTYDHPLSESSVKNGLTTGLTINGSTNAVIYPLISVKKRLYYDSRGNSAPVGEIFRGNLHYSSVTRGLTWDDLKPAIKAIHVIEAIEQEIGIDFTRDFFGTTPMDNLYLWLNTVPEDNTEVSNTEQSITLDGWNLYNSTAINQIIFSGTKLNLLVNVTPETYKYELTYSILTGDTTTPYVARIIDDITNTVLFQFEETKGGQQHLRTLINNGSVDPYRLRFEVTSTGSLSFSSTVKIDLLSATNVLYDSVTYETGITGGAINTESTLQMYKQFPKIKAIDFITGIWKMFNLTAYYVDDIRDANYGKIYVDTLDNFYNNNTSNPLGGTIDIQDYIDITESVIDSALPYTEIDFSYQEPDTLLAEQHLEKFGQVFGDEQYRENEANIDNDRIYTLSLPFAHFKYERIRDINPSTNNEITRIQWGYSASGDIDETTGDYNSVISSPLLFYGVRETGIPSGDGINWINNFGSGSASSEQLLNYWRPSNANEAGGLAIPPTYSLNFDAEVDEWQSIDYGLDSGSLFNNFYKEYIEEVFSQKRRLSKFTCHLPVQIVQNFKLNDYIKILSHLYKINTIKLNLNTGKAEVELLNII